LDGKQIAHFADLVSRRQSGEPVAYITGRRGFWSFDLRVSPDTLIPRPETELLVEMALEYLPASRPQMVLDLGTGSGAIALALAKERPLARIIAVDASPAALAVAEANAVEQKLANIHFEHGDWFAGLANQRFDVIVSNPPYIEADDAHLVQGDLRFEPRSALAAGDDGLSDIRVIVHGAPGHLNPQGWLMVEHGWRQGAVIRQLFAEAGFVAVETEQDLEQRERVTLGRLP
jgi:release factor glutamine methyltransferase